MKIFENPLYIEDIQYVANFCLPWEKLNNSSIFITGATGQIGSMLIDVIMYKNYKDNLKCKVFAVSRNIQRLYERFENYLQSDYFEPLALNVCEVIKLPKIKKIDYILHLASNTHPLQYSNYPISTITTNIIGLNNILDFASQTKVHRCLFASSNEIYGENKGDTEKFTENYCGYIDCNTLRAGYTESKRCGEALCQAYIKQNNLDIVIPRITRTYGPTLLNDDSKALSQFIHKAIFNENIVLKSDGKQYYSYLYIADTITGILTVLLQGESGCAYNISDAKSDIRLRDLAQLIANYNNVKVDFEIPDLIEAQGYSKATKALLDNTKISNLGWKAKYNIKDGIIRTLKILKSSKQ